MEGVNIEEAHNVIDENDIKNAKYIIVHVSTNQVEISKDIQTPL